jgi:agmatine/peptidylarginine deiminase
VGPIRNVAEFEKMQSVLIRYPFGISYAIIREMSLDINVITIVASTSEQTTVLNNYTSNNVNIANCSFLIAPTNTYWSRDYGPWFIFDGNDEPGIIDFPYNRPRPLDDEIPAEMSDYLGINLFGMDVIHTGGNYMTDGMGISSSSDLVWDENPSLTQAEIAQAFEDYLGISNYMVVPDPNISSGIDHIDCWGKFLDVDKVLIRQTTTSDPEYDELEATAAYYASQISSYGTPYQVIRIYTPNDEPYSN